MHVDTLIYVNKLFDTLKSEGFFKQISEEDKVNEQEFEDEFREYIEAEAQSNYEANENPILSDVQFEQCVKFALVTCTLSSMMDKGLIKAEFCDKEGDIAYSLTEQVKEVAEKLSTIQKPELN